MTLSIHGPRGPNAARLEEPVHEVKFTYRGIEWRHVDSRTVAADTWKTPYLS
jgi:type VI protein secretion system component Hcp